MNQRPLALISVSDKTGIVDLAKAAVGAGYGILSTGGTARVLAEAGVEVQEVSQHTDFPEMLDGRVKTLHPKIHGGLLARRDLEAHRAAMAEHGIAPIDLVVVNLYPFEQTVVRDGVTRQEAIEQIDIGGPSMLRSAAKNHESVCVVCDPADYAEVSTALRGGGASLELRQRLATKVFARTAAYDAAIAAYLGGATGGQALEIHAEKLRALRYGENPHQKAAFYRAPDAPRASVAAAEFLGGNKELSYNNILDLDAALALVREFRSDTPACAIIKHNNPCGTALGNHVADAFDAALSGDPVSAFGSIIACNVEVDRHAAERMAAPGNFIEALIAPSFSPEAIEVLRGAKFGKNLRILATGPLEDRPAGQALRSVSGGYLVQDEDAPLGAGRSLELEYATKRRPSHEELRDLRFAWSVVKHVRSNAIVLARDGRTVGVGAGQMSRVDAVEIAVRKAGERARGAVLASDAFFPFPDGLLAAADAGVTACIQPGGSRRDAEVVQAANERDVAMILTGMRHFKH